MPCLDCAYYQPATAGCLAPDARACPWATAETEGQVFPVVTRRKLFKICYMVTRRFARRAIPVEESLPPAGKTRAWLLARLPVRERHVEGGRERSVVGCYLFVEGLRVVDLSQYPIVERVTRDGVILREGTSVYEAVLYLTRVPLDRILAVLQIVRDARGQLRATLYRLPST